MRFQDAIYEVASMPFFKGKAPEQLAGFVSIIGSSLFFLGNTENDIFVAIVFLVGEIILMLYGDSRAGYSCGCVIFSAGDAIAIFTHVAYGNITFQWLLALMAIAWIIGAARGPLAKLGEYLGNEKLIAAADWLQPISSLLILLLRIPTLFAAFAGGNYVGAATVALWTVSDFLLGKFFGTTHRSRVSAR